MEFVTFWGSQGASSGSELGSRVEDGLALAAVTGDGPLIARGGVAGRKGIVKISGTGNSEERSGFWCLKEANEIHFYDESCEAWEKQKMRAQGGSQQ